MADHPKNSRMLICPACFAREIDPVPLHRDRETSEHYCTKCTYVATDAAALARAIDDHIRNRHGIDRHEPV